VTVRRLRSSTIGPVRSISSPSARGPARRSTARIRLRSSAGLEPEHGVGLGAQRGEHDDRHDVAALAQRAADLVAVRSGPEADVEQHDVELARGGAIDGGAPVRHRHYAVSIPLEEPPDLLALVGLVVDDEDVQGLSRHRFRTVAVRRAATRR
jgi:hypothetical protein